LGAEAPHAQAREEGRGKRTVHRGSTRTGEGGRGKIEKREERKRY